MDDERFIIDIFRFLPSSKIKYLGRPLNCLRIERLIRSRFFSKSWIDSSSKSDPPPDFHSEKHKIMMDVMRIDDCVNERNNKNVMNSFQRAGVFMRKHFGTDYKFKYNASLFFNANTKNNKDFNFKGYFENFKRVLENHSNKVSNYRKNYPKCKTCVLFVCDESNNYIQLTDKTKIMNGQPYGEIRPHFYYDDKKFLDVIKNVDADYVVWFGCYKLLFVNEKKARLFNACIYDVKHIKYDGINYDHSKMFKVTNEKQP